MDHITWLHSRKWDKCFAWFPVKAAGRWYWLCHMYRLYFPSGFAYRVFNGDPYVLSAQTEKQGEVKA